MIEREKKKDSVCSSGIKCMRELKNDESNIHVIKIPFTSHLFLLLFIFFYTEKNLFKPVIFCWICYFQRQTNIEKNLNLTETHVFVSRTISKMLF